MQGEDGQNSYCGEHQDRVKESHVGRKSETYNPSNQVTCVWSDVARGLRVVEIGP